MTQTFAYRVRDRAGKLVEGTIEAEDARAVAVRLREMGYVPVGIGPEAGPGLTRELHLPGAGRIRPKDVAVLTRQLATMVGSGLPLLRSLAVLAEQTDHARLAEVVARVRIDVERGASLSAALARHPKAFGRLYVAMVRSGETAGALDSVLVRLADTLERQVALRRKVASAMTYPAVVAALVVAIVSAMLLFVIPMFTGLYAELGGSLPAPTRLLVTLSGLVRGAGPVLVIAVPAAAVLLRRWAAGPGRPRWDAWRLRAPVFGSLVRRSALARFSRTLSALVRSGVPILEALDVVADTAGNEVVAAAVRDARRSVRAGDPIARRLADHPVFPPMVVQMLAVGEETGALDQMLDKIADFYDQEVEATVDALTSLIEPLLVVVMGVCVGGMVVALYLPMFNVINLIK